MQKLCVSVYVGLAVLAVGVQAYRLVEKMSLVDLQPAQRIDNEYDHTWENFKARFDKHYKDEEEKTRWATFKDRVQTITKHNSEGHTFTMKINQFADWSQEEIEKHRGVNFGTRLSVTETASDEMTGTCNMTFITPLSFAAPDSVDWRQHGLVTDAKDQGHCGSCYSFSTAAAIEGQHARKTGQLVSLSEQQIIDCSGGYGNAQCGGGLVDNGFRYIRDVGGLETELSYPYIDHDGPVTEKCKADKSKFASTVTGCMDITSGDEEALKNAVASVGPVSIAIDAEESFKFYSDGIFSSKTCSNTADALDHAILVVGYGSENGQDYWIVKNSWAKTWGQGGFGKMARNKNMCGVATFASYPLV
eukprot:GHVL01024654.1.p1 GENE.GHVL01024654.1~~GHVL01024654.1.p1  ORF type:complete len:361 (+),score=23.53 GHVL01024654.1:89-1171(+)